MTQVIGMVFRGLAFQGSDRRLSTGPEFDPASDRANKSLVVSTGESISLVGYTGLAEVDLPSRERIQMDSFLAGACCHTPVWPWKPPSHDNDLQVLQVGQVVQRIVDWLTLLHQHSRGESQELVQAQMVQLVGFRRDRKERANPYSFVVSWNPDMQCFGYRNERLFAVQSVEPQVTLTPGRGEGSRKRITDFLNGFVDDPTSMFEGFGQSLTGFTHLLGVGGEFLVLMLEPLEFTVYVDFISETGDLPVVVTPDGDMPVVPIPWHVAPGLAAPPVLTNMDSGGGRPDLRFQVPFAEDSPTTLVKMELERVRKVGSQRYELPPHAVMHEIELPAGSHTIEISDRPDPSKHL